MGAGFDSDGLVDDVALDPRGGGQPHLEATDAADHAAMVAAVGGYVQFRRVELAMRAGRPIGNGPAAHTLSVALLLCLILACAYLFLRE